jgi:hypothetical protein
MPLNLDTAIRMSFRGTGAFSGMKNLNLNRLRRFFVVAVLEKSIQHRNSSE